MTEFICSESGKVRFASRSEATRSKGGRIASFNSYQCRYCDGWHHTSRVMSKRTGQLRRL